ncbi:Coq4 family protein [Pseudanabaena sp. PCC 6802]|uniref:Coq4 family protein n=1 Tax=Pseudanabaena sp. PCC 6802 TaxID=118173 RepID=UPI0003480B5C|nr:Coq4 family protein [Pseudanabaena sp. PCC 6802]
MIGIPSTGHQLTILPGQFGERLQDINPLAGINWVELRKAYSVFIDNPSQGILHIITAARRSTWQKWVINRLARQAPHLQHADLQIDMQDLLQLPEDTLGGAYAKHIVSQGFDPEAFATPENVHWVDKRASLSHDVYHVITGFDGTPVGEFGLAAFAAIQYRDLLNAFVLSHVPYFMMGYPKSIGELWQALLKGFRMGLQSKPVFAYPFEQNWHKPVQQVRQELGII